jgi:hypothetical protein
MHLRFFQKMLIVLGMVQAMPIRVERRLVQEDESRSLKVVYWLLIRAKPNMSLVDACLATSQ